MKKLRQLLTCIILCGASMLTPGCNQSDFTPDNAKLAASAATTNALAFVKPGEQQKAALETGTAAHAIRTLATGHTPTVAEFQATLKQFGGPTVSQGYTLLAANLGTLYQLAYPKLVNSTNAALTVQYLESLAEGVEAGAAPYLDTTANVTTASRIPIIDPPGTGNVLSVNAWERTPEGRRLLGRDAGRRFRGVRA